MKVLIVGLGSIAKKHIKALKAINNDFVIYALRTNNPAVKIENIHNIYDYDDIVGIKPDFCIISNPSAAHFRTLENLVNLQLPLFIDKPIFTKIGTEEERLVSVIKENNLPNYVACNMRFLDSLNKIKNIIKNERINEVNVYCGSYLPDWRPGVDFKKVYSANKEMGGGVHLDLIHELDYLYWFFGKPLSNRAYFRNKSSLDISAFDYANYIWEYDDFTANVILNYYRIDAKRTLEILTSKYTYLVDLLTNSIYKDNALIYQSKQEMSDTYETQLRFFIDRILTGKNQFNSAKEAYEILELCMA